MQLSDLDFQYPQNLVALEPQRPSRILRARGQELKEINKSTLLEEVAAEDAFVINDTRVMPARVFSQHEQEILFVRKESDDLWQVLFPARGCEIGDEIKMPGDLTLTLVEKGLPQKVRVSKPLEPNYFEEHGQLALPPYIQQNRRQRHNRKEDKIWYQTAWAKIMGSTAAPTASLHFNNEDLDQLRKRGTAVLTLTLHVGPGTFLPVRSEDLHQHEMHEEWVDIPRHTIDELHRRKQQGGKVWALGTTATRALESWAGGLLEEDLLGARGWSRLFIYPPYEFKMVDALLTNFHQPRSTLLALVAAFAGLENAQRVYRFAVDENFRLFSYGDLSVWSK